MPFSMSYLQQVQKNLGDCSMDSNTYVSGFNKLVPTFDLSWKDLMAILNQTITETDRGKIGNAAVEFGD